MLKKNTSNEAVINYQTEYDSYWASADRIGESSGDMNSIAEQIAMNCGIGRTLDVGSGEGRLVSALLHVVVLMRMV